jgi:hypothetical protein
MVLNDTTIGEKQKPLNFGKIGLSIKAKIASNKAAQNNGIKLRKDSQNRKEHNLAQIQTKPNHS